MAEAAEPRRAKKQEKVEDRSRTEDNSDVKLSAIGNVLSQIGDDIDVVTRQRELLQKLQLTPRSEYIGPRLKEYMNRRGRSTSEEVSRLKIGSKGGVLEIPSCTVSVPGEALVIETEITCQVVNSNDVTLPLNDGEMLVSDIISLGPHGTTFRRPVSVNMQYSSTSSNDALAVAMLGTEDGSKWMELKATKQGYDKLQVSVDQALLFAVVSQPVHDQFTVTSEGNKLTSSTCPNVEVIFSRQAVQKPMRFTMQVQEVPRKAVEDIKAYTYTRSFGNLICTSPIVQVKNGKESRIQFNRPVTVRVPHPQHYMSTQHEGPSLLRVMSCEEGTEEWTDVTDDTTIRVTQQIVEFEVTHFTRWIVIVIESIYDDPEEIGPIPLQLCTWLKRLDVQFIALQQEENPNHLLVECSKASETEEKHAHLLQKGYKGPLPSDVVRLFEGQRVKVSLVGNLAVAPFDEDSSVDKHITFHSQRPNRLQILVNAEKGQEGLEGHGVVAFYELPRVVVGQNEGTGIRQILQCKGRGGELKPPQRLCQLPVHVPYTTQRTQRSDVDEAGSQTLITTLIQRWPWAWMIVSRIFRTWISRLFHRMWTMLTSGRSAYREPPNADTVNESNEGVRRHFFFIKENVSADWTDLSFHLGFNRADEDNIADRNHDHKSRCMDMLNEWQKRNGKAATIKALIEALEEAGLKKVVDGLKERMEAEIDP